jgi:hypothetical protein
VIEQETTRLPVRSALFKQDTGGLVVRWVTTSESPLLYVFAILLARLTDFLQLEERRGSVLWLASHRHEIRRRNRDVGYCVVFRIVC